MQHAAHMNCVRSRLDRRFRVGVSRSRIAGSALWIAASVLASFPSLAHGTVITLKNGMQVEGSVASIASVSEDPFKAVQGGGEVKNLQIGMVDDSLRRVFFYNRNVGSVAESDPAPKEQIRVEQRLPPGGRRLGTLGSIISITPFDEHGRRVFTMAGPDGALPIHQGVTLVTPYYTQLEGLLVHNSYMWDMRIATNSLPRETLSVILKQTLDQENANERLRAVRLYLQADRFKDARVELQAILDDFPDLADLRAQEQAIRQLEANRSIREIETRQAAGQHRLAFQMLSAFPSDGVASETLLRVKRMLDDYKKRMEQRDRALALLEEHMPQVEEEETRRELEPLHEELKRELSVHTLDRMADYLRLADDESLTVEQKLSLAFSTWLLGTGGADENLAVTRSLAKARAAIVTYLTSDQELERRRAIEDLNSLEGATPANIAKLLAIMKPTHAPPMPADGEEERDQASRQEGAEEERANNELQRLEKDAAIGYMSLTTPGVPGESDIAYRVQLPPEYDPHRRYPCIVTLHGSASTPDQQIDWWNGAFHPRIGIRMGHAARFGYITIAPQWTTLKARKYEYTSQEHAAVLYSLRDACRRFSIDTDRVFLSGHSIGGDAAWDIGLAHPDLWAGVIPIVATSDKYVARYWPNAEWLPFYFVAGQMDHNRTAQNSREFDRLLTRPNNDCMLIEYQGRGHEHFSDEILNIFEWMNLSSHVRVFHPKKFNCVSMRPWDNFFYWVECERFPDRSMVLPVNWPESGAREAPVEGEIPSPNTVRVDTSAAKTVVYLSPELVDFSQRIQLVVNRRRVRDEIAPSIETILEDVRTRGDRKRPFWAKVVVE